MEIAERVGGLEPSVTCRGVLGDDSFREDCVRRFFPDVLETFFSSCDFTGVVGAEALANAIFPAESAAVPSPVESEYDSFTKRSN